MAITVAFTSAFQDLTRGRKVFLVRGDRLSEVLIDLEAQVPGLKSKLLDTEGKIHLAYQVIRIRGDVQELCQGPDCEIEDGDELVIAPIITGGQSRPCAREEGPATSRSSHGTAPPIGPFTASGGRP